MSGSNPRPSRRPISTPPLSLLLAVVIGVSLVGYLRGTARSDYDFDTPLRAVAAPEAQGEVPRARSYRDLRLMPRGHSGFERDLLPAAAATTSPGADRPGRRAYEGAPPVVPHPVRQAAASECAVCHEHGVRVAGKEAPAVPHRMFAVCVQCHPMAEPDLPWGAEDGSSDPRAVPNRFAGLEAPEHDRPRWTGEP